MKRQLFLAILISLVAISLLTTGILYPSAAGSGGFAPALENLELRVSGTTIALGPPSLPQVPYLVIYQGVGNLGRISGQGLLSYSQFNFDNQGKATFNLIQGGLSVLLESTGETLLLIPTPAETGWVQLTQDLSNIWEQNISGSVAGGTGRFAGAGGTFTISVKGFGKGTSGVTPWEGKLSVRLD